MNYKFGAYLVIPFKYSFEVEKFSDLVNGLEKHPVQTMDINENIKSMFNGQDGQSVGFGIAMRKK